MPTNMKYRYTRKEIFKKWMDDSFDYYQNRVMHDLLATKKTKKKCQHLKESETVYLRTYCEAGCDCPNCHNGDGADRVKDCIYCQLKWKDKGQYDAKKYPQFVKDRKPFKPSPQPEIEPQKPNGNPDICRSVEYVGDCIKYAVNKLSKTIK